MGNKWEIIPAIDGLTRAERKEIRSKLVDKGLKTKRFATEKEARSAAKKANIGPVDIIGESSPIPFTPF